MTSGRLFISLSCFQKGNKMRLLLGLRGYGSPLHFAQIWVKEKNYLILFYNLKANHCQLSTLKYKRSFLRKCSGSDHSEKCAPVSCRGAWGKLSLGCRASLTPPKLGEVGEGALVWPRPCSWPCPVPGICTGAPDSPCAQQDMLPPSLGSSPHLSEKATPSCSPGTSPWGNVCSGLAVVHFCLCVALAGGWLVSFRLSSHPQTPPCRAPVLQATLQPPSVPQDQVPDNQGQPLRHQSPRK